VEEHDQQDPISAQSVRKPENSSSASPEPFEFLSVEQFAQRLGVSTKLIRKEIQSERIFAARVGRLLRIHVSELGRYRRA
jgi:excisionase family DNA binding protein